MSICKRSNGTYQVRVARRTDEGRREIRRVFLSEQEALRFEAEVIRLGPDAFKNKIKTTCTLKEAADLARTLHWQGNKDANQTYARAMMLVNYLGADRCISDVHPEELVAYKQHLKSLGNKGSTINRKLACVSKLWEAAAEKGYVSLASKPYFKREKEPKGRIRWLFPEEEQRLSEWFIRHGRKELADHLKVSIDTGMRTTESLMVDHEHVTDEGLWIEPIEADDEMEDDWFAKNAQSRVIPLTSRVKKIIAARHNHSPIFADLDYHVIYYWWQKARDELFSGDNGVTPYVTRHTCASRLVQKKMHMKDLQKFMGHTNLSTTERYAKNSSHDIKYAVELLEEYQ